MVYLQTSLLVDPPCLMEWFVVFGAAWLAADAMAHVVQAMGGRMAIVSTVGFGAVSGVMLCAGAFI